MSYLTLAKSIQPPIPGSGKTLTYFDKNGVRHTLDDGGLDIIVSGRTWYNWCENSGFWFAQRQDPTAATTYSSTASRAITADRWGITNENASTTYQRTDTIAATETGLRARWYGNFLKITNQGKLVISQMLAGTEGQGLKNTRMRLQLKMKALGATATAGNVWRIGIIYTTDSFASNNTTGATFVSAFGASGVDPTLGTNIQYVQPVPNQFGDNCTMRPNGADCIVTKDWQTFGAMFDMPKNYRSVLISVWSDDQVRTNNGVAISEVMFTHGQEPQVWCPDDYNLELLRVQRYYCKTFAIDTAPAQNIGADTGHLDCILGKAGATVLAAQWSWRLPSRSAGAGTVTTYNPAAANANGRDINTGTDLTTMVATQASAIDVVRLTATGIVGMAVGDRASVHATCDCEFI